jgi:hypothetical protein
MKSPLLSPVLLAAMPVVVLALACSLTFAQSSSPDVVPGSNTSADTKGFQVKELHTPPMPTPFPLGDASRTVPALEFRAPEAMIAADSALVASNEAEIVRRADLQGFRLGNVADSKNGGGSWGYEQAVCPAFPDHVLLEYSRDNGRGDVTLFAVAVPRGEGHVRVIPVRRRSYSLFTPAASNSLTINDFNHIVKEEGKGLNPDWLTLGLCYSALAGGHVRAALQAESRTAEHYPLRFPARLLVSNKGGAEVHFADDTPGIPGMDWVLNFAQDGRLLKVKHMNSRELREVPVKGQVIEAQGVPIKGQVIEVNRPSN